MISALSLLALTAANSGTLDPASARAIEAFNQVCLENSASLSAARQRALASPWSFVRKGDLPAYGRGPAMETYASGDVELLLRAEKKGFGCLVVYQLTEAGTTTEGLAGAISALPGLSIKGSGKGKTRVSWNVAQPAGSEVQMTIYPDMNPRAPILALESKGSSN